MTTVDLSKYENRWYKPGRPAYLQAAWFFVGLPVLRCPLLPLSKVRRSLLRLFGAEIAEGVIIKPGVRVKYPWRLKVGSHCWIGEDCWIDNLDQVTLGDNVCISQGAYLCTGNHDWSDPGFGLLLGPIEIEAGAWVGARAMIAPGVTVGQCAVLSGGSVATKDIPAYEVHAGNPAHFIRLRVLRNVVGPVGGAQDDIQDLRLVPTNRKSRT